PATHGAVGSDFDLSRSYGPDEVNLPLTPAAVLIGLVERDHGLSVILTRRADTLRRHTGQIALPGGRRDPGETPWQTALREAHERELPNGERRRFYAYTHEDRFIWGATAGMLRALYDRLYGAAIA